MNRSTVRIIVLSILVFNTVLFSLYYRFAMDRYDKQVWSERLSSIFVPSPEKIDAKNLHKYVGTLVDIPSGNFDMGHEFTDAIDNASPVHEVAIEKFQMMEAEVTFEQWDACVAEGGCTAKPEDEGWGRGNYPVINVSYDDIVSEYIPWLYQKTGYSFELPSEAQWEYAARAGTNTFYAFGDSVKCGDGNFGRHSHHKGFNTREYCFKARGITVPVKSYAANPYGLFDMNGNVDELIADQYFPNYQKALPNGKPVHYPAKGTAKIDHSSALLIPIRGGNFSSKKTSLFPSFRNSTGTSSRSHEVGFRLVLNQTK